MLSNVVFARHDTPCDSIRAIVAKPCYDSASVTVGVEFCGESNGVSFLAEVAFESELVASGRSDDGRSVEVKMPEDFLRWTPDHPFLYDLKIIVLQNGRLMGERECQFAMRCFGDEHDENGVAHFTINHLPVFLFGPTYSVESCSEDSVCHDLQKIKDLGYNMVRLQGELKPQGWYGFCDRIGLVVWHDALEEVSIPLKSVSTVEVSVPIDEADPEKATDTYIEYANKIYLMAYQGFSAAFFGRFSDGETDRCGLMQYNGKLLKFNEKRMFQINQRISHAFAE